VVTQVFLVNGNSSQDVQETRIFAPWTSWEHRSGEPSQFSLKAYRLNLSWTSCTKTKVKTGEIGQLHDQTYRSSQCRLAFYGPSELKLFQSWAIRSYTMTPAIARVISFGRCVGLPGPRYRDRKNAGQRTGNSRR